MTELDTERKKVGLNLTWSLLDSLGRAIVRGSYNEKDFPTEADICVRHQVSRSVTREAMKMLAAKGMVQARPKQGTIVRPIDDWNFFDRDVLLWLCEKPNNLTRLRQLNELRVGMEPQAAALAAVGCSGEQLVAISSAFERLQSARCRSEVLDAEINFHSTILLACNNPFFAHLRIIVTSALKASSCQSNPKLLCASVLRQSSVHDAIKRRDADGARAAMTALLKTSQPYELQPIY